jgi:hypothetical protein
MLGRPPQVSLRLFALGWAVLFGWAASLRAEVEFMPGDAFFSTYIRSAEVDEWEIKQELALRYWPGEHCGAFNGICGFSTLKVTGFDKTIAQRFRKVISDYEERIAKAKAEGKDPFDWTDFEFTAPPVLIYNKDFNSETTNLYLKYNESWCRLQKLYPEDKRINLQYCTFIPNDAEVILDDWRNSESVAGLNVTVPDVKWWVKWEPVEEAVSISLADVKFIVPMLGSPKSYYYDGDHDAVYYIITKDSLRRSRLVKTADGWIRRVEDVEP